MRRVAVRIGPRTIVAVLAGSALALLLVVHYWLGTVPALLTGVGGLQVVTLLAVGKILVDHRRSSKYHHEYRQVEALLALHYDIRPRAALPPTRVWAASPDLLHFLYEVVREEQPARVLECGSGLSTVVMAYALQQNGCGRIVSLEHLDEYVDETRRLLRKHGLDGLVDVHRAPLGPIDVGGRPHEWYALEAIPDGSYDLLVVDGPPRETQKYARYPALPLLHDRLSERGTVVLDDYGRADERNVGQRWSQQFPEFRLVEVHHEKGTAVLRREATPASPSPGRERAV